MQIRDIVSAVVALLLLPGCSQSLAVQASTPPSRNQCLAVAQREADELWNGRLEVLPEIIAENATFHSRERTRSVTHEQIRGIVKEWRTAFPDIKKTFVHAVVDGDSIATIYLVTGTHQSDFLGIRATGRPVSFHQMNFVRCRDGKAVEIWEMFNLDLLKRQMSEPG